MAALPGMAFRRIPGRFHFQDSGPVTRGGRPVYRAKERRYANADGGWMYLEGLRFAHQGLAPRLLPIVTVGPRAGSAHFIRKVRDACTPAPAGWLSRG